MSLDWSSTLVPLLQIEGGVFYLGHKVFTWKFEDTEDNKWLVRAWTSYLIGTPGIIGAFLLKENWIYAALEAGGIPMMLIGLHFAKHGLNVEEIKPRMKRFEPIIWAAIAIGIGYSSSGISGRC